MHVRIHFVCRMWWTKRTKGKEFTATRHKTFQWIIKLLSTQIFHINVNHEVTPMHVCRLTVTTKTKSIFVLESLNLMVWFFTLLDDERTLSLIKPQEKKFTDWWCAVHQFLYISMEFLVFMPHHVCHWLNYGENIFTLFSDIFIVNNHQKHLHHIWYIIWEIVDGYQSLRAHKKCHGVGEKSSSIIFNYHIRFLRDG